MMRRILNQILAVVFLPCDPGCFCSPTSPDLPRIQDSGARNDTMMSKTLQERREIEIEIDRHLNDLDDISRSEHVWIKLDLCFFGCKGNRGPEDPFGCVELGLDVVDAGCTRHACYLQ